MTGRRQLFSGLVMLTVACGSSGGDGDGVVGTYGEEVDSRSRPSSMVSIAIAAHSPIHEGSPFAW